MKSIAKYIFLVFSFLLLSKNAQSQSSVIDSLKKELFSHKKYDTTKVNLLNSLAYNYNDFDIDKAEEKVKEASLLAKKLNYSNGIARNYLVMSNIHITKAEYPEAFDNGLKALRVYEKMKDYSGIISSYGILARVSIYQNELAKSLEYYEKGLLLAKDKDNLKGEGAMLKGMGNVSLYKGDLDLALDFYQKSIVINKKINNKKEYLSALNNTAIIYNMQGRSLEALDYFNKCLVIHREDNNKQHIATTTLNLSSVYWERYQHEKALTLLQESLELSKELKDKRSTAKCLVNIGAVYMDLKEYPQALDYLNKAVSINRSINNKNGLINCHNQIGALYLLKQKPNVALTNFKTCLELSQSIENKVKICYSNIGLSEVYFVLKDYSKALSHGLEGKKTADELKLLPQQKEVTLILSKTYEALKKYEKSFIYFKLHKTYNDSIFNKENIEKITQLEYEYKYQQELESASNREIKLTKSVESTSLDLKKSQRNSLIAIIIILLVSILSASLIFYLKLRNSKAENQNILIEQKLLRSQMTPHFIFNSLSVLQGMILNKEEKKAVSYLSKFSKLLRIILENSRDKTVLLSQELIAIENYLALHNIEENEAYNYSLVVDKSIDILSFNIPPMLIQPFIENAIEHAFGTQKENRKIDIHLKFANSILICTISDNGIGIDTLIKKEKSQKKSLATTITSERLKILSKDFKMRGSMKIEDRVKFNEHGTIVTLVIPYKIEPAE